jgi:hypothetical protein
MRYVRFGLAAALLVAAGGAALAQGAPSSGQQQMADPAESAKVDSAYTAACTAKVSKELCGCVVQVANLHINDVAERQVFYDYMMGDVDKAKAQRAMFPPEKSRVFNVALQKADTMLKDACDRYKPAAPAQPAGAAPKP